MISRPALVLQQVPIEADLVSAEIIAAMEQRNTIDGSVELTNNQTGEEIIDLLAQPPPPE
jgi:hypothetical protein